MARRKAKATTEPGKPKQPTPAFFAPCWNPQQPVGWAMRRGPSRCLALVLATAFLANSSPAAATVFTCSVEHAAATLAQEGLSERPHHQAFKRFIFDGQSGLFRWVFPHRQGDPQQFEILNRGWATDANGNDWVAFRRSIVGTTSQPAMLKIRPWERPTRFVLLDHMGDLFVGPCTP